MIVPEKQSENYYVLNVENAEKGLGYVEVQHFTDPSGRERVEVIATCYTNSRAGWACVTREITP